MSDVINSLHAVRRGNKWYVAGGGGAGSTIHTFNSVEEMNAANLPDGTIACVPSSGESGGESGGGGFEVITLTTPINTTGSSFSEEEAEALLAAYEKGKPIVIKCSLDFGTMYVEDFSGVAMRGNASTVEDATKLAMFAISFGSNMVQIIRISPDNNIWVYNIAQL